jgi:magnesium-transporting ATPase (P-type)
VGDILLVRDGETFPADLIQIATSNNGVSFISTSSLDGEKNLKKRFRTKNIEKYILNSPEPERIMFVGECISELPSSDLEKYNGNITICEESYALTIN